MGDNSVGELNSVAVTNNHQQAETGSKMIHIGKNTKAPSFQKGFQREKR
jgi:Fe-S cluster assembly protein SufB